MSEECERRDSGMPIKLAIKRKNGEWLIPKEQIQTDDGYTITTYKVVRKSRNE